MTIYGLINKGGNRNDCDPFSVQ